jgi:hypothetical protein
MAEDNRLVSYMISFLQFSLELLDRIFTNLGRTEWKRLRLINKELNKFVTPYCFKEICFELGDSSLQHLVNIASHKQLAQYVQILVLRRPRGLRHLGDFNSWKRRISLPYDPSADPYEFDGSEDDVDGSVVSHQEWLERSESEKEALYHEYEVDRKTLQDRVRMSTSHIMFRKLGYIEHKGP